MEETIMYRGRPIKIMYDEFGLNPRKEYDNIGTIAYKHSRYDLGEEEISDPIDFLNDLLDEPIPNDCIEYSNDFLSAMEARVDIEGKYAILPLYLYDHSGLSISTGSFRGRAVHAEWDSGQVGYIYAHIDNAKKEFGKSYIEKHGGEKEALIAFLEGEIEEYDKCLRGECYYFEAGGETLGGYLGSDHRESGLLDEAESHIDWEIKAEMKERFDKVKAFIKNNVPLSYRVLPKLV